MRLTCTIHEMNTPPITTPVVIERIFGDAPVAGTGEGGVWVSVAGEGGAAPVRAHLILAPDPIAILAIGVRVPHPLTPRQRLRWWVEQGLPLRATRWTAVACPRCGLDRVGTGRFCTHCGVRLGWGEVSPCHANLHILRRRAAATHCGDCGDGLSRGESDAAREPSVADDS
jgi:hypothetical protein